MKFTVMIPTFRRQADLERCLDALKRQIRPADEVIVTVRDIDSETQKFLANYDAEFLPVRIVILSIGGVIAAMNEGLRVATGDLIAITDDDTTPYLDWLERIEKYFVTDPTVGGVGGRDQQPSQQGEKLEVGIVRWYGRVVGNHHLGTGPARDVDVLKGANCAYRAHLLRAIGFDRRLLGDGAQVHWELGLGLKLRRSGWRLVYDPAIVLDHFPATRHDNDKTTRGIFSTRPHCKAVHNGTLCLWEHFSPMRRIAFTLWWSLIGTSAEPGLLLYLQALTRRDHLAWPRLRSTLAGRLEAMRTARRFCAQARDSSLDAINTPPAPT